MIVAFPFAVCQNSDDTPQLDHSGENFGGAHIESSMVALAGISVHFGGDVRQYPVMEEEGEGQEEGEENVDSVEHQEKNGTPKVQVEGEEDHHQTNNDNEDEDSRRARVTRDWEAIDQV